MDAGPAGRQASADIRARSAPPRAAARSGPGGHGAGASTSLRVLVVDDNRDTADTLAGLLEIRGYFTRVAHDGPGALGLARKFRPHYALLDLGLPKLDGYGVAERIREELWGKGVVLIAVTGWNQELDKQRSAQAGFDRHVVKPVDPDALIDLLASFRDRLGGSR